MNTLPPPNRDEVLKKLASLTEDLKSYHVKSLALFGSVARNEAHAGSDIDLLVEFNTPVGLFHFVRLRDFLCTALHRKVDLVPRKSIRKEFRKQVLKEAIRAA